MGGGYLLEVARLRAFRWRWKVRSAVEPSMSWEGLARSRRSAFHVALHLSEQQELLDQASLGHVTPPAGPAAHSPSQSDACRICGRVH